MRAGKAAIGTQHWVKRYAGWQGDYAIDPESWEKLGLFASLLEEARLNVTALRGQALWEKGILDSLTVLTVADQWEWAADIGSGGGFPGMVLAIVRPRRRMDLIEARVRRADFLRQCARELQLTRVRVFNERAERLFGPDSSGREQYDLATVRAVGTLRLTAELGLPAVRIGGQVVGLRGMQAREEAAAASGWVSLLGGRIARVVPVTLPSLEGARYLVVMEKMATTERKWPRIRHLGE